MYRRPPSVAADWFQRLHGWCAPPPLLMAISSSPTGRLICRQLVSLLARLAYYAAVDRRLRLHRSAASSVADWCLRLYSWLVTPPLMDVYDFTAGLPPSLPTSAIVFTAGPRRNRLVSSLPWLHDSATVDGHLHYHRRLALVATD